MGKKLVRNSGKQRSENGKEAKIANKLGHRIKTVGS